MKSDKTKVEELAEKMFANRQQKQIEYARMIYRNQCYMLTNDAYLNGFADEKDQQHAKWTINLLETLFGKGSFKYLK